MATIFRPPLVTRILPRALVQVDVFPSLVLGTLQSRDQFFGLAGHPTFDFPNPRGPVWTSDVRGGFVAPLDLTLLGQDQFFDGAGRAPVYDWPNPPPRPSPWASLLSQPVPNLLVGVLARPIGHLDDQPNPRGATWTADVRGGFSAAPNLNLASRDSFFGLAGHPNFDFPNPRGPVWAWGLRTGFAASLNLELLGQDQFFGAAGLGPNYAWPNPTTRASFTASLSSQPATGLLPLLAAVAPFSLSDWPNPRTPAWSSDLRAGMAIGTPRALVGQDAFFGLAGNPNRDQPNPTIAASRLPAIFAQPVLDLLNTTLGIPPGTPTSQSDWPVPRGAVWSSDLRAGFTRGLNLELLGKDAFFGLAGHPNFDQPSPQVRRAQPAPDYFANLLETVLAVPVGKSVEQPNPPTTRRPAIDYSGPPNLLTGPLARPVGAVPSWDNPALRRAPQQPDALPPLLLTTLASVAPFSQTDWPLPRTAGRAPELLSFLGTVRLELLGQDQFFGAPGQAPVYDWPNPRTVPTAAWFLPLLPTWRESPITPPPALSAGAIRGSAGGQSRVAASAGGAAQVAGTAGGTGQVSGTPGGMN